MLALSRADAALGELSGVGGELPDPQLLDASFKRQEALCSSRIEGAEVSLSDLLLDQVGAARADRAARPPARGAQLHLHAALRRRAAARGAALARVHQGPARAPAARRGRRRAHAGRVPHLAELARPARRDAGDGDLRAGARRPSCRRRWPRWRRSCRSAARCPTSSSAPCCTRSSRASTRSSAATAASAGCSSRCSSSSAGASRRPLLYLSAFLEGHRDEYYALLQRVRTHDEWAPWLHVLRRRRARDGRARDPPGARAHPPLRARPREGQGPRAARWPTSSSARPCMTVPEAQRVLERDQPHGAPRRARARGARPARGVGREALAARVPGAARPRRRAAPARGPAQRPGRGRSPARWSSPRPAQAAEAAAPRRPPHGRGHGHHRRGARPAACSCASPAGSPSAATAPTSTSWTASTRTSTSSGASDQKKEIHDGLRGARLHGEPLRHPVHRRRPAAVHQERGARGHEGGGAGGGRRAGQHLRAAAGRPRRHLPRRHAHGPRHRRAASGSRSTTTPSRRPTRSSPRCRSARSTRRTSTT